MPSHHRSSGLAARVAALAMLPSLMASVGTPPAEARQLVAGEQFSCATTSVQSVRCWGRRGIEGPFDMGFPDLDEAFVSLAAGVGSVCGITAAGAIRCAHPGAEFGFAPVGAPQIVEAVRLEIGDGSACALRSTGEVDCWGGNGSTVVTLQGVGEVVDVSLGARHGCVVIDDGTVRCWGDNGWGQLGDGTLVDRAEPVAALGISSAVAIAAGASHTCALLLDGTAWCWGINDDGELGRGGFSSWSPTPAPVQGLANATALVASGIDFNGHTCALLADGAVSCWGNNSFGQLGDGSTANRAAPVAVSGLTNVAELTVGGRHSCARLDDGRIECWGWNSHGQLGDGHTNELLAVPAPVAEPAAIAALGLGKLDHSCAAMTDGSVRCWGSAVSYKLGNGTYYPDLWEPVTVPGLTTAQSVALGYHHSCALLTDGRVRCWGNNHDGQIGDGTQNMYRASPTLVDGLDDAEQLVAGNQFNCALRSDGSAVCWGSNSNGQLGAGGAISDASPYPVPVGGVSDLVGLAAGAAHACGVRSGGSVSCWGLEYGPSPVSVPGVGGVSRLSAGATRSCAVAAGGSVWCWNAGGSPSQVGGIAGAVQVASGLGHDCARFGDGSVACWGANDFGQLGDGTQNDSVHPVAVPGLTGAIDLVAGARHTCVRLGDGTARCWGHNARGQLGIGHFDASEPRSVLGAPFDVHRLSYAAGIGGSIAGAAVQIVNDGGDGAPVQASPEPGHYFVQWSDGSTQNPRAELQVETSLSVEAVFAELGPLRSKRVGAFGQDSCAIVPNGELVQCWGDAAWRISGEVGRAAIMSGFPTDLVSVAGPADALCALTAGGELWCRGYQPGNGEVFSEDAVRPTGLSGVIDVARNYGHVCAALSDGSVWCWGWAYYGLGDGSSTDSQDPVQVLAPGFGARGVAAGLIHMCAWNAAGQARCWGANGSGQIGTGSIGGTVSTPALVAGLAGVVYMDAALSHTCAALQGGNVYCWGGNDYGQLGNGSFVNSPSPALASNFSGTAVTSVFAGNYFTCVQFHTGQLACNGANYYRQTAASGVLYPDPGQVALGAEHGCALLQGQAQCWGNNASGQAGNGRFGHEYEPVQVVESGFAQAPVTGSEHRACAAKADGSGRCWGGNFVQPPYLLEPVNGLGAGALHVGGGWGYQCALRDDARAACWGSNFYGMLGDGTTEHRVTPAPVAGPEAPFQQLASGGYHSCALGVDGAVACWGLNNGGQAGGADLENRLEPGPVAGLANVVQIDAGASSSCAVDEDGAVWCWGHNGSGQLGNGSTDLSALPVQVQGLPAAASQVAVGGSSASISHACALLVDGRIACWGNGWDGQLGQGLDEPSLTPVLVDSPNSFLQVSTGDLHSCGLSTVGDVYCWGWGREGQLGVGTGIRTPRSSSLPLAVSLPGVAVEVYAGVGSTCALLANAEAWCWGKNQNAQLGAGRRGVVEQPIRVMGFGLSIFASGFEP